MTTSEVTRRTALVTGVNNPEGIGAAIAQSFAKKGLGVVLCGRPVADRRPCDDLPPGRDRYAALQTVRVAVTQRRVAQLGAPVHAVEADLADPEVVPALFDEAEEHLGPVDVVVHSAAHSAADSFGAWDAAQGKTEAAEPVTAESHDRHFAVNTRAGALLIREFARRFRRQELEAGRVIVVSTDAAAGHAGRVSYGASKAALESYCRAAAWELGPEGITVNAVAPGPVQTGWIDPDLERDLVRRLPTRRLGRPEDVAEACLFLASPEAAWITGQVLRVNGGNVT